LHKVLRLPLTEDKYLKHTIELSLEYYRGVMANAR
jgi:nuclear pore complex protein Nup98-Nup96